MNNVQLKTLQPARINPNPKQLKWIEDKFGHLKPIIRANARLTTKELKPC